MKATILDTHGTKRSVEALSKKSFVQPRILLFEQCLANPSRMSEFATYPKLTFQNCMLMIAKLFSWDQQH